MDREGKAGSLTDGLTGWIAELAGCCWADRNAQKHWADTNMPFQELHSISNDFALLALCSFSSWPTMLLCTLATQPFFFNQCAPPTDLCNREKGRKSKPSWTRKSLLYILDNVVNTLQNKTMFNNQTIRWTIKVSYKNIHISIFVQYHVFKCLSILNIIKK